MYFTNDSISNPRIYHGLIYQSDFNTSCNESRHIAERIAQDESFNRLCAQNYSDMQRRAYYESMRTEN